MDAYETHASARSAEDDPAVGGATGEAEDVLVVESAGTADRSTAGHGAHAAGANGVPARSTDAAGGTVADPGGSAAEWSEIKALFVDDPSASVRRAAALVERAVDDFKAGLRQRQDALGPWEEGDAAGTEELRKALRGYRSLFDQLAQIPGPHSSSTPGQASSERAAGAAARASGL